MFIDTKKTENLPEEIFIYKKSIIAKKDPIKKEVFSFSEIAFILNNIVPFPVSPDHFYKLEDKYTEEHLLTMLALNYLSHRYNSSTLKVIISKSDLLYGIGFIEKFFEYHEPVLNNEDKRLWIYPKIIFKKYLSDCVINNEYDKSFVDDSTLEKVIMIMTGFVKYEFENVDNNIVELTKNLNLPTMILANIKLYEKGILQLIADGIGVSITMELNPEKQYEKIFTSDLDKLKHSIIKILNQNEREEFTINDFIE